MSKKPRKPSARGHRAQGGPKIDERWIDLARKVTANPDDPASLRIMSAVNDAMRPAAKAAAQVVEALVEQLDAPSERTEAAVAAAVRHWESVCKSPMDSEVLRGMKDEAVALVERRRRQPPPMESIVAGVGEPVDMGYELSLHLNGLRGTWHRLWASIALGSMMGESPEQEEAVQTVRKQFEGLLGRSLSTDEWRRLVGHARDHGEAMQGRFAPRSEGDKAG